MKTYEISVWEEQGGTMFVSAKSKKQANKIALSYMEVYGFEKPEKQPKEVKGIKITHRGVELL